MEFYEFDESFIAKVALQSRNMSEDCGVGGGSYTPSQGSCSCTGRLQPCASGLSGVRAADRGIKSNFNLRK